MYSLITLLLPRAIVPTSNRVARVGSLALFFLSRFSGRTKTVDGHLAGGKPASREEKDGGQAVENGGLPRAGIR